MLLEERSYENWSDGSISSEIVGCVDMEELVSECASSCDLGDDEPLLVFRRAGREPGACSEDGDALGERLEEVSRPMRRLDPGGKEGYGDPVAADSNLCESVGEEGVLKLEGDDSGVGIDWSPFSRVERDPPFAVIRWFDGIEPGAFVEEVPKAGEPRVGVLAGLDEGELQDPGFVAMAEANCEGYRMSINKEMRRCVWGQSQVGNGLWGLGGQVFQ